MELEEALRLLKELCAIFKGTLQEHRTLQAALQVVEDKLNVLKEEKKEQKK